LSKATKLKAVPMLHKYQPVPISIIPQIQVQVLQVWPPQALTNVLRFSRQMESFFLSLLLTKTKLTLVANNIKLIKMIREFQVLSS